VAGSLIKVLRNSPQIHGIVYVSCNLESFEENIFDLCVSNSTNNIKPFTPIVCHTLDMFPQTLQQGIFNNNII
jgi:tRNA/tmRNA/rRNA uracil-C5-methylase (TrmA/RlmC/RlmD family)